MSNSQVSIPHGDTRSSVEGSETGVRGLKITNKIEQLKQG